MDRADATPRDAAAWADPPLQGWNVPLIRNGEILERPVDQRTLTQRYTGEAVQFITENRARPFFLYFAHTFPHVPLFASPEFRGRSPRGIYGDTVEELDWSVGEVIRALRAADVAENTLVFFTSDNGPWLTQGLQGGSAALLRDGKASTWEGGQRVPAIAWWPGRIAPGIVRDPANAMDLFTTCAVLAGAALPSERPIDGMDLAPVLFGGAALPERPFFYYRSDTLAACRLGVFKLHFSTQNGFSPTPPARHDPPWLFDLGRDPGEQVEVAAQHPDVVERILAAVHAHQTAMQAGRPQFD
jgi:arylsulfatase A-like enzyme